MITAVSFESLPAGATQVLGPSNTDRVVTVGTITAAVNDICVAESAVQAVDEGCVLRRESPTRFALQRSKALWVFAGAAGYAIRILAADYLFPPELPEECIVEGR